MKILNNSDFSDFKIINVSEKGIKGIHEVSVPRTEAYYNLEYEYYNSYWLNYEDKHEMLVLLSTNVIRSFSDYLKYKEFDFRKRFLNDANDLLTYLEKSFSENFLFPETRDTVKQLFVLYCFIFSLDKSNSDLENEIEKIKNFAWYHNLNLLGEFNDFFTNIVTLNSHKYDNLKFLWVRKAN